MPVIEVDDLTFHHPEAAEPAGKAMTFAVDRGGAFGSPGPSGAGKSTTRIALLRVVTGHLR